MLSAARRWVIITTSPNELIVEHAVLFGRKKCRILRTEINSIRVVVANPNAYSITTDSFAPTYEIGVIKTSGQVVALPGDGMSDRDLQWLAIELDNDPRFVADKING